MDPIKFSESAARFREHTLRLQQQRRHTLVTTYVPSRAPPVEAAALAVKKKSGPQCSARTLEGRQCPFGAAPECSGFCKKHFSMK
jgi:hypothetical protein